jgi:RNA polymerase sigma factor (sigma-70 family)
MIAIDRWFIEPRLGSQMTRKLPPTCFKMSSYACTVFLSRLMRCLKEMAEWLSRERKPTPHHIAERGEEWRWVQQAVASLPLAQRVVVVLYYINDLPLQEIASILDIPVGTVKSRLHYGRRALKKQLGLQREMLTEVYYEFT